MSRKLLSGSSLILAFLVMSCSLLGGAGNLVGGGNSGTVTSLWEDVPRMDNLNKADLELPLTAKLAVQAFTKASSNGAGSLDFISFTTSNSPLDVVDFYTLERMKGAGWDVEDQPGCSSNVEQGGSFGGSVCIFVKESGANKKAVLLIFSAEDKKTKQTQVFFARMDVTDMKSGQ